MSSGIEFHKSTAVKSGLMMESPNKRTEERDGVFVSPFSWIGVPLEEGFGHKGLPGHDLSAQADLPVREEWPVE